jgi:tetratricopeptide (TPR) repeat protein
MSDQTYHILRGTLVLLLALLMGGWFVWTTIRKSEDPLRMVVKWIVTALVLWFMFAKIGPSLLVNPLVALPFLALCGVILAITWRHSIASLLADAVASLFDGGTAPPEARPYYSTAQAHQKRGRYLEAVAEIRRQLDRFPTDVEGHLLLAQIQADDLKDLPGAELTLQRFCGQSGHAPANIAFALYSLADWHLKLNRDREAARQALEQVITLLPETEYATGAAQRIAHLAYAESVLSPEERRKFKVTVGPTNLGITRTPPPIQPGEKPPGQAAADYVKHLEQHPLDTEAREQLAILYVDHFHRLDLARDQLEQLINHPSQPHRLKVKWLNLLADLQVRGGADYDTVRATLERIVELDPRLAAAEKARNRIALLKLEFKALETPAVVPMGTYEQNLGLKHGVPRRPGE